MASPQKAQDEIKMRDSSYKEFAPTIIRKLERYIRGLCSRPQYYYIPSDERKDVAQDVLLKLLLYSYKYIPDFQLMNESQRLQALCKLSPRFTRHTCIDHIRRSKHQPVSVENPEEFIETYSQVSNSESLVEIQEIVFVLRRNMPSNLVFILVLREVMFFSSGEIAIILGMQKREIHSTLQRARRIARRILLRLNVEHM